MVHKVWMSICTYNCSEDWCRFYPCMEHWEFSEYVCISDKAELSYIKFLSHRAGEASEKLPAQECYQLLVHAQNMLQKEYIQKQYRAKEEIDKRSKKCYNNNNNYSYYIFLLIKFIFPSFCWNLVFLIE